MENEGKGGNDGLGVVLKNVIEKAKKAGEVAQDYRDVAGLAQRRTKGKPARGKYAKYQQYVFNTVDPEDIQQVRAAHTISGAVTKAAYHWRSCGEKGKIQFRGLPCRCPQCGENKCNECPNKAITGEWETRPIRLKPVGEST
jgi:hypothetical protein